MADRQEGVVYGKRRMVALEEVRGEEATIGGVSLEKVHALLVREGVMERCTCEWSGIEWPEGVCFFCAVGMASWALQEALVWAVGEYVRAGTVAQLLIDLGVVKSHSRPYTPTDNPYSESQFKTMKYRPEYPEGFNEQEEARDWARGFFRWYNHEHHHSGLGLMTPAAVHYDLAEEIYAQRRQVLAAAYAANPERFVGGEPTPPRWPDEVWINRPRKSHDIPDLVGPATSKMEPGAETVSRAGAQRSLDTAEHLATTERAPDQPEDTGVLLPKFQCMLSQNR